MRSNTVARMISAAFALTLLTSSAASAQIDTTAFPEEYGPTLLTSAITSALDDARTNDLILTTVRDYHLKMGGTRNNPANKAGQKAAGRKGESEAQTGGWMPIADVADPAQITQTVVDTLGQFRPNLMVVSGGDNASNASIARINGGTVLVDLGQTLPCLTDTGQVDDTGACTGSASAIPGNYAAVEFAVEDGAYLAGLLAARYSRADKLGIISGYAGCHECERYIHGFVNGARSVEPEIDIEIAYLAEDEVGGFGDGASAKTFTEAFIDVFQPDVILPLGRGATLGMIEAACEADNVLAIGSGYDVGATNPTLDKCVMASITTDVKKAIEETMFLFSFRENQRLATYGLANGGVGLTDDWEKVATMPVDARAQFDAARLAIQTGELDPCPEGCRSAAAVGRAAVTESGAGTTESGAGTTGD